MFCHMLSPFSRAVLTSSEPLGEFFSRELSFLALASPSPAREDFGFCAPSFAYAPTEELPKAICGRFL